MNLYAIRAIYTFEMARAFRTLAQSILSPVLSTSLYFIVFGSAIGSRMHSVGAVSYAAFIVPGLIMVGAFAAYQAIVRRTPSSQLIFGVQPVSRSSLS